MKDRAVLQRNRRNIRDRSAALVLVGTALFMPPLVAISQVDFRIAGIPVPILFIFATWIALIVGAGTLAHSLRESDVAPEPGEADEPAEH